MGKFKDLTGQKFGKLRVLKKSKLRDSTGKILWTCICDCGQYTTATTQQLKEGKKKSCGCLKKQTKFRFHDLTGQKFNHLTALKYVGRANKNNQALWLCRCDCGNETIVGSTQLTKGYTKSCGCGHVKDLTGQKFGKLTVIKLHPDRHKCGCAQWLCKCDCGKEVIVRSSNLTGGITKSCGCLCFSQEDLVGQKFGRLTVVERVPNRKRTGHILWKCRCSCGGEIVVPVDRLKRGVTKSCGCLRQERNRSMRKYYKLNIFGIQIKIPKLGTILKCKKEDKKAEIVENDSGIIEI